MIQEFIDGVWGKIAGAFGAATAPFQWLVDWWPMLGHITIFIVLVIVCGFIARFLPDKLKMWLLGVAVIAFAFLAGETNQFKKHLGQERERREAEKRAKAQQRTTQRQQPQPPWKWPW